MEQRGGLGRAHASTETAWRGADSRAEGSVVCALACSCVCRHVLRAWLGQRTRGPGASAQKGLGRSDGGRSCVNVGTVPTRVSANTLGPMLANAADGLLGARFY